MGLLTKFFISFSSDIHNLADMHPLKTEFEDMLRQYVKRRWGIPLITSLPELPENDSEPTIAELRQQAEQLILESHRLEALGDGKRVYTLRRRGIKQFLFADASEKEARFWALQNPHDENRLYEEHWVKDPGRNDKLRTVRRIPMDIPTLSAKNTPTPKEGE